jgi:hypothetical protein
MEYGFESHVEYAWEADEMQIDYVMDSSGDWEAVYVDGEIFTQDHAIRVDKWLELLSNVSFNHVTTRRWEFDFEANGYRWAPNEMLDIIDKLEPM